LIKKEKIEIDQQIEIDQKFAQKVDKLTKIDTI